MLARSAVGSVMRGAVVSARTIATTSSPCAKVGFIGLGQMGARMADNLTQKGHELVVFDVVESSVKEAASKAGVTVASSPKEVAAQAELVVTMLPSNDTVRQVYAAPDGVLASVRPGSLLVDSSTVDPALSQEVGELAKAKEATFVDAPVSGGVNAAAAGTLTFMVGAESGADFDRAKALLDLMGKNVYHCGAVGTGQAVKICNNMLLGISMIGVSETMNLGQSLGLDPKVLANILSTATGRCWSVDTYNPVPGVHENVPSSNDYKGGFGSSLMLKDLGLAADAATRTQSPTPLGSVAHQIYKMMSARGYAGKDFSSAYQFLRESEGGKK